MRVTVESPFHGKDAQERADNLRYLKDCLRESCFRGESPFASHGFYPLFLNEDKLEEREMGIACNIDWIEVTELVAVYTDRGITHGMMKAIEHASIIGKRVEFRKLGGEWSDG